ncbi:MAG: hypothetical protein NZV14_17120 [Bryobacteraceae bacterium]|nr:hypothetical protein [Bryobacteraceae bacterium]MDW8379885.1 hypothetical protein [Bryobacterales bacterium]
MPIENEAQRKQVVAEAQRIVSEGAHYLWGCQSAGEFCQQGVTIGPNRWGARDEEKALFAARYGASGNCAGRALHPDVRTRQRWTYRSPLPTRPEPPNLIWPRFFRDPDNHDRHSPAAASPGDVSGRLVYGESCVGKEHYDCAGFVRHCFGKVLGRSVGSMRSRSRLIWRRGENPRSVTQVDIWPGDLAYDIHNHHVGVLSGRDVYGCSSPSFVYHAFSAMFGVIGAALTSGEGSWVAEVRRWELW